MSGDSGTSSTIPEIQVRIGELQRQYINASIRQEVSTLSEALIESEACVKQASQETWVQRRAASGQE